MSRGWVTGWLIAGLLVVSPGRALGQSAGKSSERAGEEIPTFLEGFEWVAYDPLPKKGHSPHVDLYRTKRTGEMLALYDGTLIRHVPDTDEWVPVDTGPQEKCGKVVSADFFETSDGRVWLETSEGLLAYQPEGTATFRREDIHTQPSVPLPLLPLEVVFFPLKLLFGDPLNVTCFCETVDGELWFGTKGKGLLRGVPESEVVASIGKQYRWETISSGSKSGLPSSNITGLAVGPYNTVWVGTKEGLVVWRGEKRLSTPRVDKELTEPVRFLHRAGAGRLWVGTKERHHALFWVSAGDDVTAVTIQARRSDPGGPYVYDMPFETSSGELWLRRRRCHGLKGWPGLLRVLKQRDGSVQFQVHTRKGAKGTSADGIVGALPHDWVKDMAEDGEGRLWVVTEKGVSVFDPEAERWFTVLSADGKSPIGGPVPDPRKLRSVAVATRDRVCFGGERCIFSLSPRSIGRSKR